MNYIELSFVLLDKDRHSDILKKVKLNEIEFESYVETTDGQCLYSEKNV